MLRAVFFDLYGTLVTITTDEADPATSETFARWVGDRYGAHAAAREREHPFLVDLRALRPPPGDHAEPDLAPTVAAHLGRVLERPPSPGEIEEMAAAFRASSRHELAVIPGARQAIHRLRARFRVGLISNAQRLFTVPELRELDLGLDLFDPALLSSDLGVRKPSPRIFRAALERAGVAPAEAMHVGNDPFDDVQGASATGLLTCLVDDPRRQGDGPVAPTLRLPSVADLPAALRP